MTRFAVALFGLVAAVLAVLVAGPIWIAPVAVVAVAIVVSMRSAPPVERGVTGRHPWRWLAASAGAIAAGIGLPAVEGGELSEPAWAAMAAFLVLGVALGVTGVSQFLVPSRTSPPGAR